MANLDNLIIRDAVQDDCAAITNLHNLAIQEGLLSWSCPRAGTETLDMLQSLDALNYPRTVAVNDQEVIGFAALRPVWDPREDAGCMYSANLHLVVSKQYRKEGLASRLLEHLQTHERTASRQLHRLACKVLSINTPANSWLISVGFHHCGSLKGIAEKNGIACDLEHFSKFIGPAPAVAGRGFPNLSVADPYPPKRFTLPIQPATVQIRDATMDDLPSIVGILNSAILYTDAIDYTVPLEVWERENWLASLLAANLPCLVAVVDDCIVGYACLDTYSSDTCFRHTLESSIYVRRELKRQRIGQQLGLAALCHPGVKARGTRTIVVEVHHNNGCASGAVFKAGFKPRVSVSRSFFKHGEMQSYSLYQYDVHSSESSE